MCSGDYYWLLVCSSDSTNPQHDDVKMEGMFAYSDLNTHGHSKKRNKPRALKSYRMHSFCIRTIDKWNEDMVDNKDFDQADIVLFIMSVFIMSVADQKMVIH